MTLHPREEVLSWTPETGADRQAVQEELSAILASSHFRSSKRYPALLRYVVEKALDGHADQLKERTLGIEVFDRRADYDTNADPVVRFSASEVRKRIAQYYHELASEPALQIELPLGSYAPQFRLRFRSEEEPTEDKPVEHPTVEFSTFSESLPLTAHPSWTRPAAPVNEPEGSRTRRRAWWNVWSAAVGLLIVFGVTGVLVARSLRTRPSEQLWGAVVQTPSPVLIVVGSGSLELAHPEPPLTSYHDHMVGPYRRISVSSAVALARLATILERYHKTFVVKEALSTSLPDLRERSVVLIGGRNNPWTLRLLEPLRFHFTGGEQAQIEDRLHADNKEWALDNAKPFTSISSDYAIVARYHDASTNGNVFIIAGLGPYGTEAASEFVVSPQYLEQVGKRIPGALTHANLEFVLRTDVIAGEAGPPYLVGATTF